MPPRCGSRVEATAIEGMGRDTGRGAQGCSGKQQQVREEGGLPLQAKL